MAVELALYQPEIAQNVGLLLRLGACLGVPLHIIHPTGFAFSQRELKRRGLDYLPHARFTEHDSFARFETWCAQAGRRLVLLSTRAEQSAYTATFTPEDVLMVGRESAGVPEAVAALAPLRVRIPMRKGLRSINVAIAAGIVLGEAMRQTDAFKELI